VTSTSSPTASNSSTALSILGIAILLGIGGDVLLHGAGLGLNFAVWIATLVAQAAVLGRDHTPERARRSRWLMPLALMFALCLAWRDNESLRALDVLAVLIALSLPLLPAWSVRVATARVTDFVAALASTVGHLGLGAVFLAAHDVRWDEIRRDYVPKRFGGVLAGVALAVPIVLVFGALFASADPIFGRLVRSIVAWDIEPVVTHTLLAGFLAAVSAGFLRAQLLSTRLEVPAGIAATAPTAGIVPIGIALGAMILTFLLFIAVQARYLFAGEAFVRAATGLTLAEYARRGFLELAAATALTVPILFAAEWLLDKRDERQVRSFRALGTVQMVLVGLVMISAFQRMRLYTNAYGLTEDRLFGTAFMMWIAFVLAWFGRTVLRGRPERFAFGAVVGGFATLGALNLVNPDALVVRVNVSRARTVEHFDGTYVAGLSADAMPALVARLSALPNGPRCDVVSQLTKRGDKDVVRDWRNWSVARHRAVVALRRVDLTGLGCSDNPLAVSR
jgi:hypothetical protein